MRYHRMPIVVESPEEVGYGSIRRNLADAWRISLVFYEEGRFSTAGDPRRRRPPLIS